MTYDLVNIEGYRLPDGSVATMDDVVQHNDKPRYGQEVALIKQALGCTEDPGNSIGPHTRKRVMEVAHMLDIQQASQTVSALAQQEVDNSLDPRCTIGTCGHVWRTEDMPLALCPICALTGLLMSMRARIIDPDTPPATVQLLVDMVAPYGDVP